jgi:putative flippase GtrA
MRRDLARRLVRFLMVGGFNTGLVYLAFKGLLAIGVHYLAAAAIGWAVGVGVSYVLNRSFTFEMTHKPQAREFGAFVGGYLLQLAVGQATYWVLIGLLGLDEDIAFLCNLVFTTAISFLFMRFVVFRHRPPQPSPAAHG